MNNNELDFQKLAEFALDKWFDWTNADIENCVRTMIGENFPYKYIEYAFGISKNDYYYYLNLEIKELSKILDYNAIKKWLDISEEDYQKALKTDKKDIKGDAEW